MLEGAGKLRLDIRLGRPPRASQGGSSRPSQYSSRSPGIPGARLPFVDVTASTGTGHLQKGHGVAFGDINNDGNQGCINGPIHRNQGV